MKHTSNDSGDLAALISQLWRQGQRPATGHGARDTVQGRSEETPPPGVTDLELLSREQLIRMVRHLSEFQLAQERPNTGGRR